MGWSAPDYLAGRYLGEDWHRNPRGIYLEHVATNVCIEVLNQIRLLIPPPEADAPVALGGAPETDPFIVPGLMAAAVLADLGFRVVNLGPHTPSPTLLQAVDHHRPDLVWIALTADPAATFAAELGGHLLPALAQRSADVVLGGRGAEPLRAVLPVEVPVLGSMQALADFAARRVQAD